MYGENEERMQYITGKNMTLKEEELLGKRRNNRVSRKISPENLAEKKRYR